MCPPFASQVNFLDPKLTNKGEPYGPYRYKEIVNECYLISKNLNTSYTELMNITPLERGYILNNVLQELEHAKERAKELQKQRDNLKAANGRY